MSNGITKVTPPQSPLQSTAFKDYSFTPVFQSSSAPLTQHHLAYLVFTFLPLFHCPPLSQCIFHYLLTFSPEWNENEKERKKMFCMQGSVFICWLVGMDVYYSRCILRYRHTSDILTTKTNKTTTVKVTFPTSKLVCDHESFDKAISEFFYITFCFCFAPYVVPAFSNSVGNPPKRLTMKLKTFQVMLKGT